MIETLRQMMRQYQFVFDDELTLQNQIAEMLVTEKVRFLREASLSRQDRPDFLLTEDQSIVLEVKVQGTAYSILAQLRRYAEHKSVKTIILVCTRCPKPSPPVIFGKPVHYILVRGF